MKYELLQSTHIFKNFTENEIKNALTFLSAKELSYKKGDTVIRLNSTISSFAILLKGQVQVGCDDINGDQMIMATVAPGEMFSESLAITKNPSSPIYAIATEDSEILWLSAELIRENRPKNLSESRIISNFLSAVALKCLSMNDRIQILSKKTIREKVIAYLSILSDNGRNNEVFVPLSRQDMASYLGVERSALSRELSNMQKQGLLEISKQRFKILR
ncbi:MAG: Crp/Fnr family transcriptional regulator [Clostridia bacterium]|nr:Crp/Fnr family transcriptional regulator [Clostridia bacterium]